MEAILSVCGVLLGMSCARSLRSRLVCKVNRKKQTRTILI